uniref:Uncharacterized protein n=1 Tax=Rhizophora mucronata TaxID=61149 RepID=A0A2P2N6C7_RHIMU
MLPSTFRSTRITGTDQCSKKNISLLAKKFFLCAFTFL